MPKGRFTSLDLRCAVRDIKAKLLNFRVANIYNLNGRTYLFKLSQSGVEGDKMYIIVESGIRLHATTFTHDHSDVPSVFALKLRKHIRTKRLEGINQLGFDRVVDMKFGSGEGEYHIIVEFYAAGNIIVTDNKYKIITLLRSYQTEDGVTVAVGETYPIDKYQTYPHVDAAAIEEILSSSPDSTIKDALAKKIVIGTETVEHCILAAGVDPKQKCKDFNKDNIANLVAQFQILEDFAKSDTPQKGYIVCRNPNADNKNQKKKADTEEKASDAAAVPQQSNLDLYDSFIPYPFIQFMNGPAKVIEFNDFNSAVDEYFSKLESQRIEEARLQQEASVHKRLNKVKEDHTKRIDALETQEQNYERYAQLIEQNASLVDAALRAVNSYLAQQISWDKLAELVKQAKKMGDPIASIIHKLQLEKNEITLLLYDNLLNEEEDLTADATCVNVNLSLSAHANATQYYALRKKVSEKKQKTVEAAKVALKSAERKAMKQLKQVKTKAAVQMLRKPYWFEKFNWFISSDGYIVVSGRDMQQNELLYKRYLQKGDIYVHADVHGAATCIIKNPQQTEVPPRTLNEAGTMSICMSKAWKNKIVTSAWWVYDHQVSKTAPTGEYLTTGSFMIRGKKNFLPPSSLVMGFGILFRLADESIPAHLRSNEDEKSGDTTDKEKDRPTEELSASESRSVAEDKSGLDVAQDTSTRTDEAEPQEHLGQLTESRDTDENQPAEDLESSSSSSNTTPGPGADTSNQDDTDSPAPIASDETEGQESSPTNEQETRENLEESEDEESDESEDEAALHGLNSQFQINLTRNDDDNCLAETSASSSSVVATESAKSETTSEDTKQRKGKPRISRKQRKEMKRAQAGLPPVERPPQPPKPQPKDDKPKASPTTGPKLSKAKLKKIKTKYRHQDEEERQLAMELIRGPSKKQEEQKSNAGQGKKKMTEQERAEEARRKRLLQQQIQQRRLEKDKEEEEIRRLLREEKLEMLTEEDKEKLKQISAQGLGVNLSALTPNPKPDDVLLFAIPVCAPYDALQNYKYKAKVTPGSYKKLKAAQLAISVFMNYSEATEREKELIKAIPESDLHVMISNAKVSVPGLHQLLSNKKHQKGGRETEVVLGDDD